MILANRICLLLASILPAAALAAPPITVKVGPDQRIVIPAAVVRGLGIKQKRGDLVCVQFPKPPAPKVKPPSGHEAHDHGPVETRPPKVYLGLRSDGALVIPRLREATATGFIPGKPGTVYRGVYRGGALILTLVR